MIELINHPSHYKRDGRKEFIVEMEEKYGAEITAVFCLTNAIKYLYRAGEKIGESEKKDISKAKWYFDYTNMLIDKYGILVFNGILIENLELYINVKEMLEEE